MNNASTEVLNETYSEMEKEVLNSFEKENISKDLITFQRFGSFRYLGQDHSVEISLDNENYDNLYFII